MADAPDATTPRPVDLVLAQGSAPAAKIALSEGSDPRVVAGALAARRAGIAGIILVGDEAGVRGPPRGAATVTGSRSTIPPHRR